MVFVVVSVLAVVQSLFGVGLLVFGTPTLLLMGHPFSDALAVLLPASMAVSLLQLWNGPMIDRQFAMQLMVWCIVPLALALALVLMLRFQTSLNMAVAIALAIFVILRTIPVLGENARLWVSRHQRFWLVLMGTVHGMSNLGGGLLTIFAASRHNDKEQIRHLIAVCYFCFAAVQLGVLAVISPGVFGWNQIAYATTSAIVYLAIGQFAFRWVSLQVFNWLFTGFMAGYSIILGLRAFKIF